TCALPISRCRTRCRSSTPHRPSRPPVPGHAAAPRRWSGRCRAPDAPAARRARGRRRSPTRAPPRRTAHPVRSPPTRPSAAAGRPRSAARPSAWPRRPGRQRSDPETHCSTQAQRLGGHTPPWRIDSVPRWKTVTRPTGAPAPGRGSGRRTARSTASAAPRRGQKVSSFSDGTRFPPRLPHPQPPRGGRWRRPHGHRSAVIAVTQGLFYPVEPSVRRLQPTVQRFGRPRGVRRIAHLGVVVATALAVLPALTPTQSTPSAEAATESMSGTATGLPADDGTDLPALAVSEITPTAVKEKDTVTVRGLVTNTTDGPLDDIAVHLRYT